MGTRNLTCVVMGGEFVCAQYGQWDGYPSGQGKTAVEFLLTADLAKFREQCGRIRQMSDADVETAWAAGVGGVMVSYDDAKKFGVAHPELSRDTGAKILNYIQTAPEPRLHLQTEFAAEGLFCEWAYVVDLDNNTLEVHEGGIQRRPVDGRFAFLDDGTSDYPPVTLVASFAFSELRANTMHELEARLAESR